MGQRRQSATRSASNPARTYGAVVLIVLTQWALALASIASVLLPFVLLGGVAWLGRRRQWASVAVIVLLSPLSFSFAHGVSDYWRDGASMRTVGLQNSGSTFIDPYTRLPIATHGCLAFGNEWVLDAPHDTALRLLTMVAGPPAGTYHGPIPTEEQARRALQGARILDWRELARDDVEIAGRHVEIQRWLGPALVRAAYSFDPLRDESPSSLAPDGLIHAGLWRDRVLLIELRDRYFDDAPSHVAVVDAASGRLIGHFPGTGIGFGFPLAWRPVGPRLIDMDYIY